MFQVPVQPPPRQDDDREQAHERVINERIINQELKDWLEDDATLCEIDGKQETVLEFWRRQAQEENYKYLPNVMTLTSQRVSIASATST